MQELLLGIWGTILGAVGFLFNVMFFWLPNDPVTEFLNDVSVQSASSQGVAWLNWFVDVSLYANVFAAFVAVMLAFAIFKVLTAILNFIFKALGATPFI